LESIQSLDLFYYVSELESHLVYLGALHVQMVDLVPL